MRKNIALVGFCSGMLAFAATLAYDVVQILQLTGTLQFPYDEILIYGASLYIVVPFVLEILAFHHLTSPEKQFWTHASLIFATVYAVFVTANYVVQLAAVIPAKLAGRQASVQFMDQTPHSLFWNFDAIGYISMGLVTLMALPALNKVGFERLVRFAFLANAAITPLIAFVYFYPVYSDALLLLGLPWAVTAPLSMLLLALLLRTRQPVP